MSSIGSTAAQSIAGIGNAERVAARDVEKAKADSAKATAGRRKDQVELSGGAETAEGVRRLKDPTQEESKEDRDSKARQGPAPRQAPGRRLDVSG